MPLDEPLLDKNEPPQVRNSFITRSQKKWDRYYKVDAKLRKHTQSPITSQKKLTLRTIYPIRQWLKVLRDSTKISIKTLRLNIQLHYRKLMGNTRLYWPSGGSTLCLAKCKEFIDKAEQYEESLCIWLKDVCLVWEQVLDFIVHFRNIKLSISKYTMVGYRSAEINLSIHFHWENRKERSIIKPVSKPKATRSAFATQELTSMGKSCQISQTLPMSKKLESLLLKSQRPHQRKTISEKIKKTIKTATTPIKVTNSAETQATTLTLQDLIVQQIDKNDTFLLDVAVHHTISASTILH